MASAKKGLTEEQVQAIIFADSDDEDDDLHDLLDDASDSESDSDDDQILQPKPRLHILAWPLMILLSIEIFFIVFTAFESALDLKRSEIEDGKKGVFRK